MYGQHQNEVPLFNLDDIELDDTPLAEEWGKPLTVREAFEELKNGADFTYIASDMIHNLSRSEVIDESLYQDEPIFYLSIAQDYYAMLACAIHYHFDKRGLQVPQWVFYDRYKMSAPQAAGNNSIFNCHGLGQLQLREIDDNIL